MDRCRLVAVAVITFSVLGLAGCPADTDLGDLCTLVRKNPDGGKPVALQEKDIKAGRDYVSFGYTGCEDLTCVRSLTTPLNLAEPDAPAAGRCSRQCVEGTTCPSNVKNVTLSCRALILDEVTLQAFCAANPDKCRSYFGAVTSPYFCAADAPPDAGM